MHVIRLHAFGPAQNLRYEELPDLVPTADHVRIAVEASGVHFVDTAIRQGTTGGPFPLPELPMVPGREVAGTIDAVGPGVPDRWIGRRVVAHLGQASGGYAEQAVARVETLHEIPGHLGADAAVTMIGTGRTAIAILDTAALTTADVVLVTAAAGGLGALFIQAARHVSAVVVAVAGGPDKTERARALGASVAVDYLAQDWPDQVRAALGEQAVSVVLDGVGGAAGRAGMELLDAGGRLVLFGGASGELTPLTSLDLFERSLTATAAIGPKLMRHPGGLRELETRALEEAAAGRLVPLIGQHYPLARAADAHTAMETRATVGKTVLVPVAA